MPLSHDSVPAANLERPNISPYVFKIRFMPPLFLIAALVGYGCSFSGPALVALICILVVLMSFIISITNIISSIGRNQVRKSLAPALELLLYLVVMGILISAGIGHVRAARNYYRKTHPGEQMPWEKPKNAIPRQSVNSLPKIPSPPNLSFNPDPTVRDYCHALNIRLTVGPVNFVR